MPAPVCRARRGVVGAAGTRHQRRSRLHLHPPVVRRHHGDSALTIGAPGEARGVGPPATRPSGTLWGLPRAAQPPAGGDPSYPAPTGDEGGGNADPNTVLALGQAAGPRLWSGDGHLSLLPPWHAPHYCRHHPGVSDDTHPTASPARLRPTAHCPGPWSPRDNRVRLSP